MARNHIVLIGFESGISDAKTSGTGFLVLMRERCFVVTCRHVILEAAGHTLFALPKPKKTKNPPGGYSVYKLRSPHFHPDDNSEGTYDIAVAEIIDADPAILITQDITPVRVTESHAITTFQEGVRLKAQGYPIDYASAALALNKNEPLLPKEIRGTVRSVHWHKLSQHGFSAPLREAGFAQTSSDNHSGKGMSGGVVYTLDDNRIAGMVLGSGEIEISANSRVEQLCGFLFVGLNRVLETLANC